jgi:predicted  nucleic acid-binding Zn-ribbon protein
VAPRPRNEVPALEAGTAERTKGRNAFQRATSALTLSALLGIGGVSLASTLAACTNSLQDEVDRLKDELEDAKGQLATLEADKTAAERAKAEAETRVAELTAQIDTLNARIDAITLQLGQLTQDYNVVVADRDAKIAELAEKIEALGLSNATISTLRGEKANLAQALSDKEAELEAADQANTALVAQLTQERDAAKAALKTTTDNLVAALTTAALTPMSEDNAARITALLAEITNLRNMIIAKDGQITNLNNQVAGLELALAQKEAERAAAQASADAKQATSNLQSRIMAVLAIPGVHGARDIGTEADYKDTTPTADTWYGWLARHDAQIAEIKAKKATGIDALLIGDQVFDKFKETGEYNGSNPYQNFLALAPNTVNIGMEGDTVADMLGRVLEIAAIPAAERPTILRAIVMATGNDLKIMGSTPSYELGSATVETIAKRFRALAKEVSYIATMVGIEGPSYRGDLHDNDQYGSVQYTTQNSYYTDGFTPDYIEASNLTSSTGVDRWTDPEKTILSARGYNTVSINTRNICSSLPIAFLKQPKNKFNYGYYIGSAGVTVTGFA